jgi:hypothetical protein
MMMLGKEKKISMSPDMFKTTKKHHLSNTCPPPKKYSDFIQEDNHFIL